MYVPAHRPISSLALAALGLILAACGAGGAGPVLSGTPAVTLTITTNSLPGGTMGNAYATTQLQAVGTQGNTTWSVASGVLPPGIDLDAAGTVSGSPTANGAYSFVVRVEDDAGQDTQPLQIMVGDLELTVTDGLVAGDAWTQRAVTVTSAGQTSSVTFSAVANGSGGSFVAQNPAAGTAVWMPGPTGGSGVTDTLRVSDTATAGTADVEVRVMPNPAAGYTAAFGSTDVWYVDPSPKQGSHAYATDFHKALADTGLRVPTSTDATGTTADQLAALWIRVETFRYLNPMYRRNEDGTAGTEGLAITFPFDEPGPGYTKAAPGESVPGSPTRYSAIAYIKGSNNGVIGTAFLDGTTNAWHENDTTQGSLELGVFTNQITPVFNSGYGNTLDDVPIGPADVPALQALLYGLPSPGGRYVLIRYTGRGLAKTLAAVIAHEVGHSLGLEHTNPPQSGSIMNPSASISPTASYTFTEADVGRLQSALPGAGKTTGSQTSKPTGLPAPGGVCVCNFRVHQHAER